MKSVVVLAFLLTACAKPNYVGADPAVIQPKVENCDFRFKQSQQCVSITWEKPPGERKLGSFLAKTYRLNSADRSIVLENAPGTIDIDLRMPDMGGHGSNAPISVQHVDVGTYRVEGVLFSMRGRWDIHVQIKQGNVVRDEAIIPFNY